MKLQGKAVLILPDDNPEKTDGGIMIPKTVEEKPLTGKVTDCGPGCEEVHVGNRVIYNRKGSSVIQIDEVEYHFISEHQISYIYD